jgi:hypothetical protein
LGISSSEKSLPACEALERNIQLISSYYIGDVTVIEVK